MEVFSSANGQIPSLDWAYSFGGSLSERGRSIAIDNSGNLYVTGNFSGTVDFDPGPNTHLESSNGDTDIFIQKITPNGGLLWVKTIGSTGEDIGRYIEVDAMGNIILSGRFQGTVDFDPGPGVSNASAPGTKNIYVLKLDGQGNFQWVKTFGGNPVSTWNDARSVVTDLLGNVYLFGNFQGTVDLDPGPGVSLHTSNGWTEVFCLKLDPNGDLVWANVYGSNGYDHARMIDIDDSGHIYLTGRFEGTVDFDYGPGVAQLTSNGGIDVFIQKLDTAGNHVWAHAIGGPQDDFSESINVSGSGDIYVTGKYRSTVDLDPTSGSSLHSSNGGDDIYVLKLGNNGSFKWARTVGGSGEERGMSIHVNQQDQLMITGLFNSTMDFDPGPGSTILSSNGMRDCFVLSLDNNGNFVWAFAMGSVYDDIGMFVTSDNSNMFYLTGAFDDVADFDPGSPVFNLTTNGNEDVFVARYSFEATAVNDPGNESSFIVYPNPTSGVLYGRINSRTEIRKAWISDVAGKLVEELATNRSGSFYVDLTIEPGIYFINILEESGDLTTDKFIVQ